MRVVDILSGFVPLLFFGSIAWVVFRFMGRVHQTMGNDPAMTVRQLFTYGVLFFTMILVAVGGSTLVDEVVRDSPRLSNRDLAQAFSFVIVGLPVFGLLLRYVDRRLREDEAERSSAVWAVYLNVALFTSLIGAMVGAFRVIRNLLEERADVQAYDLTLFALWAAFWVLHWGYLRSRHGIPGDTDLALGSIVGLSVLGVANIGLFYVLADEIYTWLTDDPIIDRAGPTVPEWSALFAVGFVVWLWYWFTHYESAPRTQTWFVTVVPVGALSAFIALIVAGAAIVYNTLVWFIGNRGDDDAVRHFDQLPFLSAVLLTGLSAWLYYRWLIRSEEVRNEPRRAYDYALAGAALVAGTIGAILCLSALFIPNTVQRNDVIAGFVLLATGAPIWVYYWNSIATHVKLDGGDELRSPVRRAYIYGAIGSSAIAAIIAGLVFLQFAVEDVLDGATSWDTLQDHRYAIATLITVAAVSWYHVSVFRAERHEYEVQPPPPTGLHHPRHIIVLGGDVSDLASIGSKLGAQIEYWHRTDRADQHVPDTAALLDQITVADGDEMLVLIGDDGPILIPFER